MPNTPGSSDIYSYQRKEIRAVLKEDVRLGITIAPTAAAIDVGTVLGLVTASNHYVPYNNTNTDGSEVARVILAEPVEASTGTQNVSAFVEGVFYKDRLIGLDPDAITDLKAREPIPNILLMS
ncbi:head decoration protein [Aneurinibacillus sp. Ricciae_BoGa-3]|uniref:head decoration protein n=1 Tax=Aneurinibacillus sp. Ricciae_BoGa-3 TaxID=3022697 RepID=UPI00234050A6|nr:head decoration protein [Aneurinibacillus sp. Ricciae_BoGa-3]WCK53844.1 head decoration protein [Aneurinibacillus sp. Ricciae_BoGa-3]